MNEDSESYLDAIEFLGACWEAKKYAEDSYENEMAPAEIWKHAPKPSWRMWVFRDGSAALRSVTAQLLDLMCTEAMAYLNQLGLATRVKQLQADLRRAIEECTDETCKPMCDNELKSRGRFLMYELSSMPYRSDERAVAYSTLEFMYSLTIYGSSATAMVWVDDFVRFAPRHLAEVHRLIDSHFTWDDYAAELYNRVKEKA